MHRLFLIILIGYLIGIIWGLYIKSITPIFIIIAIILLIYKFKKHFKFIKYIKILKIIIKKEIIIIFIVSIIFSGINIKLQNSKYDNLYKDNQKIELIATIISDKNEKEYKTVYKIRVDKINNKKNYSQYTGTYLLLNIKNTEKIKDLKYGMQIKVLGEYIKPDEARNEHGFNYRNYLKSIKVFGNLSCEKIEIIKENNINQILIYCNNIKNIIKNNIKEILSQEEGDLLLGILTGETNQINEEIVNYFKISNLYHLLSVSGMHVSYIILAIEILLKKLSFNKKIISIVTIFSLIFFMEIIGYSPSATRAIIMGIISLIAFLLNRKLDIINSICISMFIILLYNPFNVYNVGLWLSYGGTIGILSFFEIINKKLSLKEEKHKYEMMIYKKQNIQNLILKIKNSIMQMSCVAISAQIIILPIMILNFNTISLTFLISNLLAGYLIGIVIIVGFIFCIISVFSIKFTNIIIIPFKILINLLIFISKISSKLPLSRIYVTTPNIVIIIIYVDY